jgi:hypothetical protein
VPGDGGGVDAPDVAGPERRGDGAVGDGEVVGEDGTDGTGVSTGDRGGVPGGLVAAGAGGRPAPREACPPPAGAGRTSR